MKIVNEKRFKKYRKKPAIVEAFHTDEEMVIETLEGNMKANKGDFIIRGVRGELYPCKEDIFHETYEKVSENGEGTIDSLMNPYVIKYHLLEARKELEQLEAYYDSFLTMDITLSEKDEEMIYCFRKRVKMLIGKINMELQND